MARIRFRPDAAGRLTAAALLIAVSAAATASSAFAQDPPDPRGAAGGLTREQMWFAPTAEDWKKPVLIRWQRTWEDALRVSRETGKPILVATNMDGEIASEHYAGVRYRQPDIAKLYEPYVCVIASVYRHNPRDFDEEGNRIPCPRFGCVTCGEHIAIEPTLYEKFFDGERVAPRHVMVELDGSETYDVYYAFDTDSVFAAIRDGIANREAKPNPEPPGDRSILERITSRDSADREAVEAAFRDSDRATRQRMLEVAAANPEAVPTGLLRLALFGLDVELSQLARQALAKTDSPDAAELIGEALQSPMPENERTGLVGALDRLADRSPKASTLAAVHRGLSSRASKIDLDQWRAAVAKAAAERAPDRSALEAKIEYHAQTRRARPDEPEVHLASAEAMLDLFADPATRLALGDNPRARRQYTRLMLEDAKRAGLEAERLGATGWRVNAVLATTALYLGERPEARKRADAAIENLPDNASGIASLTVLEMFLRKRQRAVATAVNSKKEWPAEWLTDVHAAYALLIRHPLGRADHVASHYDFLNALGATAKAYATLDQGLERFPNAADLHDCLRARILKQKGVTGLETVYDGLVAKPDASPATTWYAGYAGIVAAEFHRRSGETDAALASYRRAIGLFDRSAELDASTKDTADHFAAVAHGGRARVLLETGRLDAAVDAVLTSFERRTASANTLDGLNLSAVDTAKMLLSSLRAAEKTELATKLDAALGALDPSLLALPAYEFGSGNGGRGNGGTRRRR